VSLSPSHLAVAGLLVACGSSPGIAPDADAGAGARDADVAAPVADVAMATDAPGGEAGTGSTDVGSCPPAAAPAAWASWPMPEPGGAHAQSYDLSHPDLAVDRVTGLTWQRHLFPDPLAWQDARSACACLELGGFHDWRLPSRVELVSLVDYTRQDPALDAGAFPGTPHEWFWSSSPVAGGDPAAAWYVAFWDGNTHHAALDVAYRVRCVRGGEGGQAGFAVAGDGTVGDPRTGLTWQSRVDATHRSFDEARAYCAALAVAGRGWRVPDMKELQTLIDESRADPALDPTLFPDAASEGFWTATPLAGTPGSAWFVDFFSGVAYNAVVDHPYRVRCVR